MTSNYVGRLACLNSDVGQAKQGIIVTGEKALVSLYDGAEWEGLNILQYRRLCEKVSKGT